MSDSDPAAQTDKAVWSGENTLSITSPCSKKPRCANESIERKLKRLGAAKRKRRYINPFYKENLFDHCKDVDIKPIKTELPGICLPEVGDQNTSKNDDIKILEVIVIDDDDEDDDDVLFTDDNLHTELLKMSSSLSEVSSQSHSKTFPQKDTLFMDISNDPVSDDDSSSNISNDSVYILTSPTDKIDNSEQPSRNPNNVVNENPIQTAISEDLNSRKLNQINKDNEPPAKNVSRWPNFPKPSDMISYNPSAIENILSPPESDTSESTSKEGVSYDRDAAKSLSVAVVNRSNVLGKFNDFQLERIKKYLTHCLDQAVSMALHEGESAPTFTGFNKFECVLKINCHDENSLEWLKITIANIPQLWPGCQLGIVPANQLVRSIKACLWIPGRPESIEVVVNRLMAQNTWISVDDWHVIKMENKPQGKSILFGITERDRYAIKEKGWKVSYMFNTLDIKIYDPKDL